MICAELEQKLAALKSASLQELKTLWRVYFNEDAPRRNKATLAKQLAARYQEVGYDGLREEKQDLLLDQKLAKPKRARRRQTPVVGTQLQNILQALLGMAIYFLVL